MRLRQSLSMSGNALIANVVVAVLAALTTSWVAIHFHGGSLGETAAVFTGVNLLLAVPVNLAVVRRFSVPVTRLAQAMDASHPAYADVEYIEELGRQKAMEPHIHRLVTSSAALLRTVGEDRQLMEHISLTDPLTEAGNSRALLQGLEAEIARAAARGNDAAAAFSVLIFDLDRFKEINDTLGHLTGDEVLREMADLLRQNVRKSDTALASPEHFRFGGDEFVIIAPETPAIRAGMLAERLDVIIMNYPFQTHDGRLLSDTAVGLIRASIGCASYPDEGETPDELLDLADKRMYEVKEERRRKQYCRVTSGVSFAADIEYLHTRRLAVNWQ